MVSLSELIVVLKNERNVAILAIAKYIRKKYSSWLYCDLSLPWVSCVVVSWFTNTFERFWHVHTILCSHVTVVPSIEALVL